MSLTLIFGPMFSGKTTYLVHKADAASYSGDVLYITHTLETRGKLQETAFYSHNKTLTHHNFKFDIITLDHLSKLQDEVAKKYKVICIDEGQFFGEMYGHVSHLVDDLAKIVYIAALSGTSERKVFTNSDVTKLISIADDVVILKNDVFCKRCALQKRMEYAIFTHRISSEQGETSIGGDDKYIPVCRGCWLFLNKQ